ncbi:unnamed protein product, partial [Prorocentrum cordatum]
GGESLLELRRAARQLRHCPRLSVESLEADKITARPWINKCPTGPEREHRALGGDLSLYLVLG